MKTKTLKKEAARERRKHRSIAADWKRIPDYKLGDMPEELYDEKPILARCVIAKRALAAAYEAPEDEPEQAVVDALTDIRHLCDRIGVDFFEALEISYKYYLDEREGEGIRRGAKAKASASK